MKDYLMKSIDVEMQRFGLFFTLMMASAGGSIGLIIGRGDFTNLILGSLGFLISIASSLLAMKSYLKINKLLGELRNV